MAKRLEYDIVTDPSKGIAGLKQFAGAAKKAMGEVDDSLDDTTTSAKKVAKALSGLADELETEMKGAAKAAAALGTALGPELAGRANVDQIVQDLKKMGLTFDQITADADALAGSIQKLDNVQMSGATRGLQEIEDSTKRTKAGVDDIGRSADSSRGALANMIGNSAQDMGQFAGVTGSAGVAIGQMAEYMADARLEGEGLGSVMKNFAGVAGPIAALALATQLVGDVMASVAKSQEQATADQKAWVDAIIKGGDAAENYADHLRDVGEVTVAVGNASLASTGLLGKLAEFGGPAGDALSDVGKQFGLFGQNLKDITPLLQRAGIDIDTWSEAITSAGTDTKKQRVEVEKLHQAMVKGGVDGNTQKKILDALSTEQANYTASVGAAAAITEVYGTAQRELNKAYQDALDPQAALNRVQEEGAATNERVTKILEDQAQAQRDVAAAIDDTTAQWSAMSDAVSEKSFQEAIDQFNSLSELDLAQMRQNTVKSFDDVKDAIKKAAGEVKNWGKMDLTPDSFEELRGMPDSFAAVTDAVTSMRGTIQTELKASFDTGGIKDFSSKFDFFAGQVRQQFTDMFRGMGLPEDQVQKQVQSILDDLGLLPKEKEIIIKLTRDKEAQNALDLFMGDIEKIEEAAPVVDIRTKVAAGDIQGALDEFNALRLIEGKDPIVLPTDVDKAGAEQATATALARAQSYLDHHPALITPTPDAVALQHTSDALDDVANPGGRARKAQIDVTVNGITSIGGGRYRLPSGIIISDAGGIIPPDNVGLVAERRPEIVNSRYLVTQPTLVPPGTRVTSGARTARILRTRGTRGLKPYDRGGMVTGSNTINLNINAGVVGNRYDVMKAVQRAHLDKLRLFGERG